MTKQEELELYRKALVDWEKPYEKGSYTEIGFCYYFDRVHGIFLYRGYFEHELLTLYSKRTTDGLLLWNRFGYEERGRAERVHALKQAIKQLEEELGLTNSWFDKIKEYFKLKLKRSH